MAGRRPGRVVGGIALLASAIALLVAYRVGTRRPPPEPTSRATATPTAHEPPRAATATARGPASTRAPAPAATGRAGKKFFASWGSGPDQLGHTRPEEGDPMGPMSVAVDGKGRVIVLDEINGRLVRRGADGRPGTDIRLDQPTPEDVTVAKDGSIAVLDRHGDKNVALYDASGAVRGKLPLVGGKIADPGEVTGIFTDGNDVYAERRHSELVKLGDTSGTPADPQSTLAGRPSRDGTALLGAVIVDATAGRVRVTSTDRASGATRFSRELALFPVVIQILLLDSDRAGTIYFAVELQRPGGAATVTLSCLDGATGDVVGGAVLPANTLPEESFRDFAVLDDGGVVYALRSEAGVTYQRYDCQ